MGNEDTNDAGFPRCFARRTVLQAVLGLVPGWPLLKDAMAQDSAPHQARPQAGDRFVFATGERKGNLITPGDLPIGGPPVTAYPMDPHTRIVRDGSRLNQVLLIRLEPEALAEDTRAERGGGHRRVLGDLHACGM